MAAAGRDSVTRRSAGYPRVLLAVLTTAPRHEGVRLLEAATNTLLTLAEPSASGTSSDRGDGTTAAGDADLHDMHFMAGGDPGVVASVHARNVLSALIRDVTTGPLLNRAVPDLYRLAVTGFASPNYGLCNASLLLFAALQCRIVGTKIVRDDAAAQNLLSARKFFALYPAIRDFMLLRLPPLLDDSTARNPELFLHLSALGWLRASPMDATRNAKGSTLALRPLLRAAAASADWNIRRMAARACVSLEAPNLLAEQLAVVSQHIGKGTSWGCVCWGRGKKL